MGQDFIGNIPGVQAGIEKNLTAFIQSNLQNSPSKVKTLNQELDIRLQKNSQMKFEFYKLIKKILRLTALCRQE